MKIIPKGKHISCFQPGDKLQRLSSVEINNQFIDNSYNMLKGRKSYIILIGIEGESIRRIKVDQNGIEGRGIGSMDIKNWGNDWIKIGKI